MAAKIRVACWILIVLSGATQAQQVTGNLEGRILKVSVAMD